MQDESSAVAAAVTEALDEIFDADGTFSAGGPDTVVDVAADGAWLTVRLQGPGRWPSPATESHLRVLADRVELSVGEHDDVTVLFEFPSDPGLGGTGETGGASVPPGSRATRRCDRRSVSARRRPRC